VSVTIGTKAAAASEMANEAKPFGCDEPGCSKRFQNLQAKNEHARRHSGDTPYECPVNGCGRKFKWRSSLSCHKKTHHVSSVQRMVTGPSGGVGPGENQQNIVPRAVAPAQSRQKAREPTGSSLITLLNPDGDDEPPPTRPSKVSSGTWSLPNREPLMYPCPYERCGRSFRWRSSLKSHKKAHRNAEATARQENVSSESATRPTAERSRSPPAQSAESKPADELPESKAYVEMNKHADKDSEEAKKAASATLLRSERAGSTGLLMSAKR